ncbi:hypothetical protein DRQ07_04400 [candidate division KSB1 bacterium]|nr:MAG: hypothetical protein DRQ07_04400 [candidate division KSB1 bacterium]
MQNKYKEFINKNNTFNDWEEKYNKILSAEQKMEQFLFLYKAKDSIPEEKIKEMHKEHLQCLIDIQKSLMNR